MSVTGALARAHGTVRGAGGNVHYHYVLGPVAAHQQEADDVKITIPSVSKKSRDGDGGPSKQGWNG
jgi:hypothetical protein